MAPTFLDKLPAEIRNNIYSLVLSPDKRTDLVELKEATPPSKNLMLTCKQIHAEAAGMYRAAYRAF